MKPSDILIRAALAAPLLLSTGGVSAAEMDGAAALTDKLAPHRAIYSMGLVGPRGVGAPVGVRGVMSYEVRESCEAWTTETKVMLRIDQGGGEEAENLREMFAWESKDGLGFRFRVEESRNGRTQQTIRGVAVLDGRDQGGVAELTDPRTTKIALPAGTVFPTVHLAELIDRSASNGGHFGRTVFDGATLEQPYHVSAVIGPAPEVKLKAGVRETLGLHPRWRAHIAYFNMAADAQTPDFEMNIVYRDDGIIELLRQDYGDHVIEARLQQIDFLPEATGCTPPAG